MTKCKDCGMEYESTIHNCKGTVPHVCPVCNGTGQVPEGFYRQNLQGMWMSTTIGYEPCRSCDKGIIWR